MFTEDDLTRRRERVFLVLAGVFLCAMTMLNIIGISHFVKIGPLEVAAGVLPYPLTFLCTDLVSELYGKRRANFMVTVGLGLNVFILLVMLLIIFEDNFSSLVDEFIFFAFAVIDLLLCRMFHVAEKF